MTSIAILIGNAEYDHETPLPCCAEDVAAFEALLRATDRFDEIFSHVNLDADKMRNAVRDALPVEEEYDEIFFYFSGHGWHNSNDLYLCGSAFDSARPNETGLSHHDLTDLFRAATPKILISVFDTCFSGAPLVKGAPLVPEVVKNGLQNVLQFSSSLYDQTSLGGEKLSEFSRAFLEASVRKNEGVVYYTDIKNALRDDFIGNNDQTPFFVNQGTGRERLVDDANKLVDFRRELQSRWLGVDEIEDEDQTEAGEELVEVKPLTPLQMLDAAENRVGGPEEADHLIAQVFSGIVESFDNSEYSDFYDQMSSSTPISMNLSRKSL